MNDQTSAWDEAATRRSANRTLWLALLLILVGLAAAAGCVVLIVSGMLGEPWGLPVLVGGGGLAGGALAGGIAALVVWVGLRRFLSGGPWVPGQLTLDEGKDAELAHGGSVGPVRLAIPTAALGDPGTVIDVNVRSDGDRILLTSPASRQLIRATVP